MIKNLLLGCACLGLASCWYIPPEGRSEPYEVPKVLGFKPVYSSDSSVLRIYSDTVRAVKNAGKIYTIGNYILQNDIGTGIHVLDKTDPAALKNIGFIRIPGNSELSVKNGLLYVNSYADLVVLDVSDYRNVKEVNRVKLAFQKGMEQGWGYIVPPPRHGVYYECVGLHMGIQTGWKEDSIFASCYYP